MKRLVIGLGSGRTGSMSLSYLFNDQPYCIGTHESFHMTWNVDMDLFGKAMGDLFSREAPLIVDSASYWLNYVPLIKRWYSDTKFICIRRSKEEVVGSFMRKTWGYNSFTKRDSRHLVEKYNKKTSPGFPQFDLPKKEAIGKYWEAYYALAGCYVDESFRMFDIYDLNTIDGIKSILDFAEVPEEQQVVKVFHENRKSGGS